MQFTNFHLAIYKQQPGLFSPVSSCCFVSGCKLPAFSVRCWDSADILKEGGKLRGGFQKRLLTMKLSGRNYMRFPIIDLRFPYS